MSEVKVNKISPRTACGTVTVGDSGDAVCVSAGVPVTVQGDLKSPALKATDGGVIISQSGTDITIGASGDTINLASGASQSGFGRTGTVDWDTTPKTTTVTAATGTGYFVNTTSGEVTVNLPVGAAGSIVAIADYANTADTNKIVVNANGSEKIQGVASNSFEITVEGGSVTLVYVDSTQGWRPTDASTAASITENPVFIAATGGNQPTASGCIVDTDYKIHKFTGPGTFCVSSASGPVAVVDYMVIAGGGGGVADMGGGGGAGGYRESHCETTSGPYTASPLATPVGIPISAGPYSVTVGGGGSGPAAPGAAPGSRGNDAVFSTITSAGGGGFDNGGTPTFTPQPGGSGAGAVGQGNGPATAGSGNDPSTAPPQGQDGGNSQATPNYAGGGGGGAGGAGVVGGSPVQRAGGAGGAGSTTTIDGSPTVRASGGSGGTASPGTSAPATPGGGGAGGGGPVQGGDGTVNTGGGGGGGTGNAPPYMGGSGGSGIVIIRYKFQ